MKEVSNICFDALFSILENSDIDVQSFLEQFPDAPPIEELRRPMGRTDWEIFVPMFKKMFHLLGEEQCRKEVARFVVDADALQIVKNLSAGLVHPCLPYWIQAKFVGNFLFHTIDFKYKYVHESQIKMHLRIKDGHSNLMEFLICYQNVFSYFPTFINHPEALVKMEKGEREVFFDIYLPKSKSFIYRLLQAIKSLRFLNIPNSLNRRVPAIDLLEDLKKTNTELETHQLKLERLTQDLIKKHDDLESALEALKKNQIKLEDEKKQKSYLLKIVLHDISNPFSIMNLHLNKLNTNITEKKDISLQAIERINKNAKRINQIIQTVKTLDASQEENYSKIKNLINTEDFILDIKSLFSHQFQTAGISFQVINNVPPTIATYCNRIILRDTIIGNLLTNAIKFSPIGTTVFLIINFNQELQEIEFKVIDQGIGISSHRLDSIFEVSKNKSTIGLRGEKGTGYGLVLIKEFVEKFDGRVEVSSPPLVENNKINPDINFSIGTEFRIYLPVQSESLKTPMRQSL